MATDSEETPLLLPRIFTHEEVYQRFTPARKRVIVIIVSITGLVPHLVSGTFVPSIPQIAKDLDSTGSVVGLAVSLSMFASCLGSLYGASYSSFYGRKPAYLIGTPFLFIGSMGVAASQTIPQLMVWRFIQAIGASPVLAIGSGVIGDIYKLEERGEALGILFSAILLGASLAPFLGGLAAHYYSWRLMQVALGIVGLLSFFAIFFFFPETYHPGKRGVDKLDPSLYSMWRPVRLNPLQPLWLLRNPNLLAITLAGIMTLLTNYILLVPIAYTIGVRYNIKNEAIIGACFLPAGLGNVVGSPIAGRLSDWLVVHYRKKRGGEWYAEDRLRATLPGALLLVPLSVLFCGILTQYVPGTLGLVLNLFCLFLNGLGVDFVLAPSGAYIVDTMHSRSAEAIAANSGFRSIILSGAIACLLPMIETHGVLVTNFTAAILAWVGSGLLLLTIRYGDWMRTVVDTGYSIADNN